MPWLMLPGNKPEPMVTNIQHATSLGFSEFSLTSELVLSQHSLIFYSFSQDCPRHFLGLTQEWLHHEADCGTVKVPEVWQVRMKIRKNGYIMTQTVKQFKYKKYYRLRWKHIRMVIFRDCETVKGSEMWQLMMEATKKKYIFNSLWQSDAYMRKQTRPSLPQIMACGLVGAKPLSEPTLAYCQLGPLEQISVKF